MQRESSTTFGATQSRSNDLRVKSLNTALLLAVAAAFALGTGPAFAQGAAAKEDQAQIKADQHALSQEKAQEEAAQSKLKADSKSGRMSAQSPDAEKVYKDQQDTKGLKKDLAADKSGSPQMKTDKTQLSSEKTQLQADQKTFQKDSKSGRMSAESPDAEKVYKDKQYIQGEKKDIASDKALLNKDEKK